jgi:hypothetical protein
MSAEQLDLERYATELRARVKSAGIESARVGDPDGFEIVCDAIRTVARLRPSFTAADVRQWCSVGGPVVGSAFRAMAAAGEIVAIGVEPSSSLSRHGGLVRRWTAA